MTQRTSCLGMCGAIITFLSIFMCKSSVKGLVFDSDKDGIVSEMSNTIVAIGKKYFEPSSLFYIILPTADDNAFMLDIMHETAHKLSKTWTVIANDSFCCDYFEPRPRTMKPITVIYAPDFYIISIKKQNGFGHLINEIQEMDQDESFNPRALFLFIILTDQCGINKCSNSTIASYFDEMWKQNCFSLIILVLSECDFEITVVTAKPFSSRSSCRKVQPSGLKDYNLKRIEGEIDFSIYKRNHNNFNQCKFSVAAIILPPYVVGKQEKSSKKVYYEFVGGIDLELLRLVSTTYNFTYVFDKRHGYETDAFFKILPNGSAVGITVDLRRHTTDFAMGGIMAYHLNYYKFDYSPSYKIASFGWFVSDASVSPQWKIFFGAFSQDVWILSGFVFIIVSFLYFFLDKFTYNIYHQRPPFRLNFQSIPLIQYFSVTLGLSSILKPKSICLRLLYFSWNIYSLHLCIAYSSNLFLLITNPPLEKEIATVEDLRYSGLPTASSQIFFQVFPPENLDDTIGALMKNHFECPVLEHCLDELLKHRNFSVLLNSDYFQYLVDLKKAKVHRISEVMMSFGVCVSLSKGNPLYFQMNKVILLAVESGLVGKWERDAKLKLNTVKEEMNHKVGENQNSMYQISLTVNDLKGTFFVLLIGAVFSSVTFFCELVIHILKDKCSYLEWISDKEK